MVPIVELKTAVKRGGANSGTKKKKKLNNIYKKKTSLPKYDKLFQNPI